jgi:two-component system response regulator (stage 0 sporulation protein F)
MSQGKLLVVDDEPEVRHVLQEFLTDRGYEVIAAPNGPDALAVVKSQKVDLVLLDVALPGMDGVEILRRIAELQPGLPVIMVTANADPGITSKLLGMGAVDYIQKPFDLDYLDRAVRAQMAAARDR